MAGNVFKYNHPVTVFTESGEFLGDGRFNGEAGINGHTGQPEWGGNLETNIDPATLAEAGILTLDFGERVTGRATCSGAVTSVTRSGTGLDQLARQVTLKGQGEPPRV